MAARDLHIYDDGDSYRLHVGAGGSGAAAFRDPKGDGLTLEYLAQLEVRDTYLHGDVVLTLREREILRNRQRHPYSHAVYHVTPAD